MRRAGVLSGERQWRWRTIYGASSHAWPARKASRPWCGPDHLSGIDAGRRTDFAAQRANCSRDPGSLHPVLTRPLPRKCCTPTGRPARFGQSLGVSAQAGIGAPPPRENESLGVRFSRPADPLRVRSTPKADIPGYRRPPTQSLSHSPTPHAGLMEEGKERAHPIWAPFVVRVNDAGTRLPGGSRGIC